MQLVRLAALCNRRVSCEMHPDRECNNRQGSKNGTQSVSGCKDVRLLLPVERQVGDAGHPVNGHVDGLLSIED